MKITVYNLIANVDEGIEVSTFWHLWEARAALMKYISEIRRPNAIGPSGAIEPEHLEKFDEMIAAAKACNWQKFEPLYDYANDNDHFGIDSYEIEPCPVHVPDNFTNSRP